MLVEHAIENDLSSEFGWGWTAFGINDMCASNILGHTDKLLNAIVKWDNGQTESISMDDMLNKWEAGELVAEHGSRNNLREHIDTMLIIMTIKVIVIISQLIAGVIRINVFSLSLEFVMTLQALDKSLSKPNR